MYFSLIISLIIIHFFSDWIMQPRRMAVQKSENPKMLFIHGFIIWYFLVVVFFMYWLKGMKFDWSILILVSLNYAILHMVQDWFIWRIYKYFRKNKGVQFQNDYWFYTTIAIDQSIHLILLFWLTTFIVR